MQFSLTSAVVLSTILGFAAASPGPLPEGISLFNGEEAVTVSSGAPAQRRDFSEATPLKRDNNISCKGAKLCETLKSCDDAKRKVYPANTYGTYTGASASGTCSGWCGLFVKGDHCTVSGQDLIDAYDVIRNQGHCKQCGSLQRDDGCVIKIDRVSGCNQ